MKWKNGQNKTLRFGRNLSRARKKWCKFSSLESRFYREISLGKTPIKSVFGMPFFVLRKLCTLDPSFSCQKLLPRRLMFGKIWCKFKTRLTRTTHVLASSLTCFESAQQWALKDGSLSFPCYMINYNTDFISGLELTGYSSDNSWWSFGYSSSNVLEINERFPQNES